MIKTENDYFYLTAGEACCIFRARNGSLERVYFGKRIEPEDELDALLYGGQSEVEICKLGGEKAQTANFKFVSAETVERPHFTPSLRGGKTLRISLCCEERALFAELYCTPYPRGGFSFRTVIENRGGAIELTAVAPSADADCAGRLLSFSADGRFRAADRLCEDRTMSCFVAASADVTATSGDTYGFLCPYRDGTLFAEVRDGRVHVASNASIKLGPGEKYVSAEMLAVYSDAGIGGMTRIFHDILREFHEFSSPDRKQTVLYTAAGGKNGERADECAAATAELGCDILCVDGGKVSAEGAKKTAEACREAGIRFGLKYSGAAEKGGALYPGESADKGAGYTYPLCESDGKLFDALSKIIADTEAEYVMIALPFDLPHAEARAVFALRKKLVDAFPELITEWGYSYAHDPVRSLCYPFGSTRTVVANAGGELKAKFDEATFGCLGYELDPLSLTDELRRAIRAQVFSYQDDARTVIDGDLYRYRDGECDALIAVAKDKASAYCVARVPSGGGRIKIAGLDEHDLYRVREIDKTFSGAALVNCGVTFRTDMQRVYTLHLRQVADYYGG